MDYDLSYRFGPDQPWRMKGEFDFCFISRYVGCNKRCVSAASVQREHKWMSEQMFATKTRRWYNVGPTSKTLDQHCANIWCWSPSRTCQNRRGQSMAAGGGGLKGRMTSQPRSRKSVWWAAIRGDVPVGVTTSASLKWRALPPINTTRIIPSQGLIVPRKRLPA